MFVYLNGTCRLVTKGTVDEGIYTIAKQKLTLDAAVLDGGIEANDNSKDGEILSMGAILSAIIGASAA